MIRTLVNGPEGSQAIQTVIMVAIVLSGFLALLSIFSPSHFGDLTLGLLIILAAGFAFGLFLSSEYELSIERRFPGAQNPLNRAIALVIVGLIHQSSARAPWLGFISGSCYQGAAALVCLKLHSGKVNADPEAHNAWLEDASARHDNEQARNVQPAVGEI